jgi:hypothetical protein
MLKQVGTVAVSAEASFCVRCVWLDCQIQAADVAPAKTETMNTSQAFQAEPGVPEASAGLFLVKDSDSIGLTLPPGAAVVLVEQAVAKYLGVVGVVPSGKRRLVLEEWRA